MSEIESVKKVDNTNEKISIKEKMFKTLLFLAFPMITFAVLSPLEIYVGNADEFLFGTGDFIWIFLGIGILALVVLTVVISLLPDVLRKMAYVLCFAFSFMSYIQNMFLNKTLMRTDGSKVEWDKLKGYTIGTLAIWLIIILLVCIVPKFLKNWEKVYAGVSVFISAIELVAAISILLTNRYSLAGEGRFALDGSGQFKVATDENVIVIILDRYANGVFDNAIEDNASFTDVFSDFTYYNNANSTYNYTFPSMAYMMTGVKPDCTETTMAYKERAWLTGEADELHDDLNHLGYVYRLYTESGRHVYYDASYLDGRIDNITEIPSDAYHVDRKALTFLFTKMTLFKYMPYIVKPYLELQNFQFDGIVTYTGIANSVEGNDGFNARLISDGLSVDEDMDKAVTITLLSGIHTPYTIGANGEEVEDNTDKRYECQLGINVMLQNYFDDLKELGVYDNATIIVTADHGLYIDDNDPQPIYLIKRSGEEHTEMQYNTSPISTEDFRATIYEIVSGVGPENKYGTSIFYWNETDTRERSCQYPDNGFDVYTYTTDGSELRELIREGSYTRIEATEDWD